MRRLLFWEGGKVYLDTQMSERTFAKTTIAKNWREAGLLAQSVEDRWVCREWNFEATVSSLDLDFAREGGERVLLEGECFPFATLASLLGVDTGEGLDATAHTHEEQVRAVLAFVRAEEAAQSAGFAPLVENLGAGAALVSPEGDKVLFLPKTIFCNTTALPGEAAFCAHQGWWVNPVLHGKAAVDFTKAVLLYRVIAGVLPFDETSELRRRDDVRDLNYKPLRYVRPGVAEAILAFTEMAFSAKGTPNALPFPTDELCSFDFDKTPGDEELAQFKQEAAKYFAARQKRVSSKRWLRRKSLALKVALCAVVLALWFAASLWQNAQGKPTTKGLDALGALEMHYSAMNLLDAEAARKSSTHSLAKAAEKLGSAYAMAQMASMFNPNLDTLPPAVWFASQKPSHNIWGLSRVTVDGRGTDIFLEGPRKSQKPRSQDEADGAQRQFLLDYYVLDTSGEDSLVVTHQSEQVTLTFRKNRWLVSHIAAVSTSDVSRFAFSAFKADYERALISSADVFSCADAMRESYDFIPTREEIQQARAYLERQPE